MERTLFEKQIINNITTTYIYTGDEMEEKEESSLKEIYNVDGFKFIVERDSKDDSSNIVELLYDLFEESQKE